MGVAYFYHLTRRPLEATLPLLLGKALDAGWRVALRAMEAQRLDWLDRQLWHGPAESFLPHGKAGGPHDALQPVLLTLDKAANTPACLMSIDGAPITVQEVEQMQRVCILFDGHDQEAVNTARAQWVNLKQAGCAAQYWSEEGGGWEKKAQVGC